MNGRPLRLGETIAWGLAGLVLFLGIWTMLSISGLVPRQFLPTPLEVVTRFFQLLTTPFAGATLPQHLASSLQRYLCGVLLAALVGVPLGLLMGWFRLLDDILSPIFEGLRFIAPIAWVPFAALWFGTGIGGPVHDHLCRRFSAVPDQCLSRRPFCRSAPDRGFANARHRPFAHHPGGSAAGLRFPRSSPACASPPVSAGNPWSAPS